MKKPEKINLILPYGAINNKKKVSFSLDINVTMSELPVKNEMLSDDAKAKIEKIKKENKARPADPAIPLNTEQLSKQLSKHNIIIKDDELQTLEKHLQFYDYTRIVSLARNIEKNGSKEAIRYQCFASMYKLDVYIRESLSRLIPYIEAHMKAILSKEILIYNDDPYAYENYGSNKKCIYRNEKKSDVEKWIDKIAFDLAALADRDQGILSAMAKYENKVPIWLLLDRLSFGEVTTLLNILEKEIVTKCGETLIPTLPPTSIWSILQSIRILRNAAAHGSRILGTRFGNTPKLKKNDLEFITEKQIEPSSLFAQLLTVKYCFSALPKAEKQRWNTFLEKTNGKISEYESLFFTTFEFPKEWEERLQLDI